LFRVYRRGIDEQEDMEADRAEGMARLMKALAGWEKESTEAWEAVSQAGAARHEKKKSDKSKEITVKKCAFF
jgi:hypothetical protein